MDSLAECYNENCVDMYRDSFKRLDMAMSAVRDKVSHAMTNDELDHIFDTDGFFMD